MKYQAQFPSVGHDLGFEQYLDFQSTVYTHASNGKGAIMVIPKATIYSSAVVYSPVLSSKLFLLFSLEKEGKKPGDADLIALHPFYPDHA